MSRRIKQVRADWAEVVLVCRKCSKKLDGGFGAKGDRSLAKTLRRELDGGKGGHRKDGAAVIEVDCLDICPKDAVVAINAADPKTWRVIPRGAPIQEILDSLGLDGSRDARTAADPRPKASPPPLPAE